MVKKNLFLVFASFFVLSLSCISCSTTGEQTIDERFVVKSGDELNAIVKQDKSSADFVSLEPGKLYLSSEFSRVFSIKKSEIVLNQNGFVSGQVTGLVGDMPFCRWMFHGEEPYHLIYNFVWFDEQGKKVVSVSQPETREVMPGDPVRFFSVAPNENLTKFSVIVLDVYPNKENAEVPADSVASEQSQTPAAK